VSAFIDQQRAAGFAVELTCRSIGTSPSAYYQRATGQLSIRAVEDELLLREIRRVYRANYEAYGSLRVWKALRREGIEIGRGRVERLMAADGLIGAKRRGRAWKTTVADPAGSGRPDLVNRDFTATRPDALWIADFTYLRSWEGRWVLQLRPGRLQPSLRGLATVGQHGVAPSSARNPTLSICRH
jgi:putative transposase